MKQILMNTRILNEDLTWAVHCAYIVKANRWLYALRQLKKCKVPSADIVHIYCTLIRSILEYTTTLFAGLPKYLTGYLENVRKRALSIIWPGISYETALDKAALSTLSDCRAVSCIKFIGKVRPGNPLYPLIHNRVVPISTSVCLRSGSSSRPMATRTERFSNLLVLNINLVTLGIFGRFSSNHEIEATIGALNFACCSSGLNTDSPGWGENPQLTWQLTL